MSGRTATALSRSRRTKFRRNFPGTGGKYIPKTTVGHNMKVIKTISLNEKTVKIANKMENFSLWVRIALREYDLGNDLASETIRRMKWFNTARLLATALLEYDSEDSDKTVDDILKKAMDQTTLEEY